MNDSAECRKVPRLRPDCPSADIQKGRRDHDEHQRMYREHQTHKTHTAGQHQHQPKMPRPNSTRATNPIVPSDEKAEDRSPLT
jgi:hypothetical protein